MTAAKKAPAKKTAPRTSKPSPEKRITDLENTVAQLSWYHAELVHSLRLAAIQQWQQQLASSPQVRQALYQQLVGA